MPHWMVGDIGVDRVFQLEGPSFKPRETFPDCDLGIFERHAAALVPRYFQPESGRIVGAIQSFVIRTGSENILVDTCVGNNKNRHEPPFNNLNSPYLERLAALGLQPEEITQVVLTHLHVDHVGWNTRLENGNWVPTFPNAKFVFSQTDLAFVEQAAKSGPPDNTFARYYEDSIKPVLDAGQVRLLRENEELIPGVKLEFAPGHTPGHILLRLNSKGEEGLCVGDILHNAFQIYQPDCNSNYCALSGQARATRRRVLAQAADNNALVFACHIGGGYDVRIRREGDGFSLAS